MLGARGWGGFPRSSETSVDFNSNLAILLAKKTKLKVATQKIRDVAKAAQNVADTKIAREREKLQKAAQVIRTRRGRWPSC